MSVPSDVEEKDFIIFHSIHQGFSSNSRNGTKAQITEIKEVPNRAMFPFGLALEIEFQEDWRKTWCRIDEMTKI